MLTGPPLLQPRFMPQPGLHSKRAHPCLPPSSGVAARHTQKSRGFSRPAPEQPTCTSRSSSAVLPPPPAAWGVAAVLAAAAAGEAACSAAAGATAAAEGPAGAVAAASTPAGGTSAAEGGPVAFSVASRQATPSPAPRALAAIALERWERSILWNIQPGLQRVCKGGACRDCDAQGKTRSIEVIKGGDRTCILGNLRSY